MEDKKTEELKILFDSELQGLHNCAGMIIANPDRYPKELVELAEKYLIDLFQRATKGRLQ